MNSIENVLSDTTTIIGKKFLINEWRNTTLPKISGIYKIVNKVNGKYYVGSSKNILGNRGRWSAHYNDLIRNAHYNMHFQRAWNKYGESSFEFIVLEMTDCLHEREQIYLDMAKQDGAYNMKYSPSGGKFSEEVLEKLKKSMSTSEKVKSARNGEWRDKIRQSKLGKKRGDEFSIQCRDRSLGAKNHRFGKLVSEEQRRKISARLMGHKMTDETKRKIGDAQRKRHLERQAKLGSIFEAESQPTSQLASPNPPSSPPK